MTMDQWSNYLNLIREMGDSFPTGYEPVYCAWPSLFDDFYYWYCDKKGIKYEKPEN